MMKLYTGCVDDGLEHKEKRLIRYLTVSRLSDRFGLHAREDLWKGVHTPQGYVHLFDEWLPNIGPDGKDVNAWYRNDISWNEFVVKYNKKLATGPVQRKLVEIVKNLREYDFYNHPGIVLQCVCKAEGNEPPEEIHCHRIMLANTIRGLMKTFHGADLKIEHL
ncbi:DUF488 domain-containing protein [Candidatus Pacearchaeota archaeon]|nr:DUF488 domain-containing protein [Candidatus Pacearchaeota archaeon]